jgi:hypothetical protein
MEWAIYGAMSVPCPMKNSIGNHQKHIGVLKEQKSPEMAWDDTKNKSIDQLEAELTKTSADFFAVARAFPEEMLMEDVVLPWTTLKFVEMMAYPYWNMMYHIGQITYIQTLYGDEDIH